MKQGYNVERERERERELKQIYVNCSPFIKIGHNNCLEIRPNKGLTFVNFAKHPDLFTRIFILYLDLR